MARRGLTTRLKNWAAGAWGRVTDALALPAAEHPRAALRRLMPLEERIALSVTPVTSEFRVNTTVNGIQQTFKEAPHALAMDNAGNFVTAWSSDDGSGRGVFARAFDAAGNPLTSEFRVNSTTAGDQKYASVGMAGNGRFVVVWTSDGQDGSSSGVYGQRFDAAGNRLGGEFRVNATTQGAQDRPAVAMANNGSFVVTWQDDGKDGDKSGIYHQRFDVNGIARGPEARVNTTTTDIQEAPSIGMNSGTGDYVITWMSKKQEPDGTYGVFAQRYAADGRAVGGEFQVNTTLDNDQFEPVAGMDAQGNTVFAWSSKAQDGDSWGIFAQRFDSRGRKIGGEFQVNTTWTNDQQDSVLSVEEGGNFVIAWASSGQDGSGRGVYAQKYDADGTRNGTEFLVNQTTIGDQKFASVAINPAGRIAVSWSSFNPALVDVDVYARVFEDNFVNIVVSPASGLITSEDGAAATFTVVLTRAPTDDVTIGLSSSDPAEGALSHTSVTFTDRNWNVPQTVTVFGVDDLVVDGNRAYKVLTSPAVSADPYLDGKNPDDVRVTNLDNEAVGITVDPVAGLFTTEAGGAASFRVVLNSRPTAEVRVGLSVSNPSEGRLSTSTLVFDTSNWDVLQTVTVTGVDDDVDDGNVSFTVITAAAVSADTTYHGVNAADVVLTNEDDDTADVSVSAPGGPTTEAGGSSTFSVVLTSRPTADVQIELVASDPAEGILSVTSLTFTPADWNVARVVIVTGLDDAVDDGDRVYTVTARVASSADPKYAGLSGTTEVTNLDDDTAGLVVTPAAGLTTTETGFTATFVVALASRPTADVVVDVVSSNPAEGTVSTSRLTFTAANWNIGQTVTVTGVDDFVDDGDVAYRVDLSATSADPTYDGLAAAAGLTNADNDGGIRVTPLTPLITTEAGGIASFSVALDSMPLFSVTIRLSSSHPGEGTLSTTSLTFGPLDWSVPQVVTVTGVDDLIDDGDVAYTIITAPAESLDPSYANVDTADVALTNLDDDAAGVLVSSAVGLTTEAGGTASLTVRLATQPTADVVVELLSSNPAEGVATPRLTFTTADWGVAQTVTITGVDDRVDDGHQIYLVRVTAVSADGVYDGLRGADVWAVNLDDDTAGITVSARPLLTTTEAGGPDRFTVVLDTQPVGQVIVRLVASDPSEGTAGTPQLVFDASNWDRPQTAVVRGVDDFVDDGDVTYLVRLRTVSADANYAGRVLADLLAINLDDDTAGVSVRPAGPLVTDSNRDRTTVAVVLDSEPLAPVTLHLTADRPNAVTLSASTVTFTPADWDRPQTVDVTALDGDTPGDSTYRIVVGPSVSGDPGYLGRVSTVDASHRTLPAPDRGPPPEPAPAPAPAPAPVSPPTQGPEAPPGPGTRAPALVFIPAPTAAPPAPTANGGTAPSAGDAGGPVLNPSAVGTGGESGLGRSFAPVGSMGYGAADGGQIRQASAAFAWGPGGTFRERWAAAARPSVVTPERPPFDPPPVRFGATEDLLAGLRAGVAVPSLNLARLAELMEELAAGPGPRSAGEGGEAAAVAGVLATSGYVLLHTRTGAWLLTMLAASPVWKQFDPIEVLYTWEGERGDGDEPDSRTEEDLQSLVGPTEASV